MDAVDRPDPPLAAPTQRHRPLAGLTAGALLLGGISLAAPPASTVDPSQVTVLHGIPGAVVDVYVDDALLLEDFAPKATVGPLALAPHTYAIEVLAAGAEESVRIPQASYDLAVQVAPDGPVALDLGRVAVPAGVQINAFAIGSAAAGTLDVLVQVVPVTGRSEVTVIHGIPGATVDVYVDGALLLEDFAPKASETAQLDPGAHQVKVFAAGADPGTATPVIDQSVAVPEGEDVALVANIASGTPALTAFIDDTSPVAPGTGRVQVRHTAAAPTVDIQVDGADALTGLAVGGSMAADLPAGSYDVGVQVAPDGAIVTTLPDVALGEGQMLSVYAIGSAGGGTFDVVVIAEPVGLGLTDVPFDHPFAVEIAYLIDQGLTTGFDDGFDDGTFRPLSLLSRQAVSAFLYRAAGFPDSEDPACAAAPFSDVPTTNPFCGEITWMVDDGIATGFSDGSFHPAAELTRQALAAFFARFDK